MVNVQTDGSAIKFTFVGSDHYLYGNGEITVPKNSLILEFDESDMVTFKKSDGDSFLSFLLSDSNFSTRVELEDFFKTQMCAGNASSSIVDMYVGCPTDWVESSTGVIHRESCAKMDSLNIVYVDTSMSYSMVHISLDQFIQDSEAASGVAVNADGIIYAVADPRSEKVITAYNASGMPTTSASVLSINESGITVDNIQSAIDAKFGLVKNYEISGGTNITVNADTSSPLVTKLEIINDLNLRNGDSVYTGSVHSLGSGIAGDNAFAFGRNCFAAGNDSIALGTDARAYNNHTLAMNGYAYERYSIAMGFNTVSSGIASVALCDNTQTLNNNELACGSFNESHKENDTFGSSGNTLFSLGNGTGDNTRHNAFEVMQNGDIYIQSGGSTVLLQDAIGKIEIDDTLSSGSTNPVMNSAITEALDAKQKKNIEIDQADYDQLVIDGKVDPEVLYIISDSDPIDTGIYVTSGAYVSSSSTIDFYNEVGDKLFGVIGGGGGSIDPTLSSGSSNAVANSAITLALDDKMDKQNLLNNIYPKDSVITTTVYKNPSEWLGGSWSLLGGSDSNKVYWPAFAIATDSAGTEISESLPNIKGSLNFTYGTRSTGPCGPAVGAFKEGSHSTGRPNTYDDYNGAIGLLDFDLSKGQVESDGTTYLPSSASTYQNGAQVKVESIKLFYWVREDDAQVIDVITPLTIADTVESGNTSPVSSEAVYSALSGVTIECDPTLDSGSTNPVANSAVTVALDEKMDKQNLLNNIYQQDSVYVTYEYKNPSTFIGGQWELIGGQDVDKNWYPAFALSGDSAGTTISESLPNITGDASWFNRTQDNTGAAPRVSSGDCSGALSPSTSTANRYIPVTSSTSATISQPNGISFDAASGSTTPNVYQNGAHVNVNAIKLFFWKRVDSAPILDVITPMTLATDIEDGNDNPITSDGMYDVLDGVRVKKISEADYEAAKTAGTLDPNVLYIVI